MSFKSTFFAILIAFACIVIFLYAAFPALFTKAPADTADATTPPAATTTALYFCDSCYSTQDNGKTIALSMTSRITIELPEAQYDQRALALAPGGSMGETFGASAEPGYWVRTFEATTVGTTTLIVPPKSPDQPPFRLTLITVAPGEEWQSGMAVVGAQSNGATVHLRPHERFLVRLGDLDWTLSLDPQDVIVRVPNTTTADGIQGVYEAAKAGTAVLTAEGRPHCETGAVCAQYIVHLQMTFIVDPSQ